MALIKFKYPCTTIIAGATCSGKTTWLTRLLTEKQDVFEDGSPTWHVLYCYGIYQKAYEEMELVMNDIVFKQGLPTEDDLERLAAHAGRKILVLDDLAAQCVKSPEIEALFTRGMHHLDIAVVMILQNLYQAGKSATTIARNAFYFVFFENNADRQQIATKARQMYPGNARHMIDAYEDAVRERYGYLFVDASPGSDVKTRLRTHVLADEYPIIWTS